MLIFISIFIPLITLVAFTWFITKWYLNASITNSIDDKGTLMFRFNLKSRNVLLYKINPHAKNPFKIFKPTDWISFDNIINFFPEDSVKKTSIKIFHKLENGSENEEFDFISNLKKHEFRFKMTFTKIEDDNDFILEINWDKVVKTHIVDFKQNRIEKTDVYNEDTKWKGFIAFNISQDIKNSEEDIIQLAHSIYPEHKIKYLITSGFVVFVFYGSTALKLKKQTDKFMSVFLTDGRKKGMSYVSEGSAIVASNQIDSPKKLNWIIQVIDFLINVSIKKSKNFASYKNDLNKDDFTKFTDASKSFRLAVRAKDIKFKTIPVRYWKSRKKVATYITPFVDGINPVLTSQILNNKNNKEMITDSFASLIATDKLVGDGHMFDVNAEWLIQNKNKINNKRVIYLVNLGDEKFEDLLQVTQDLKSQGIIFAIRIRKYDEKVITSIQGVEPDFLVVSQNFWNKDKLFDTDKLVQLMSLKKVVKDFKSRIVFENPSDLVDDETAEKIGLNLFYDNQ